MIMDERHVLMNAYILRRVIELPYDDPRRKALLEILHNEFATNLLTGLPAGAGRALQASKMERTS